MRRALRTALAALACLAAAAPSAPAAGWSVPGFAPVESAAGPGGALVAARFESPTQAVVVVSLPSGHALLRDAFAAHAPGVAAEPRFPETDPAASDHAGSPAFAGDVRIPVAFDAPLAAGSELSVEVQVCGPDLCYLPETLRFPVPDGVGAASPTEPSVPDAPPESALELLRSLGFADLRVVRTLPYATDKAGFLAFLRGEAAAPAAPAVPRNRWLYALSLLLAGFLLNLTPCVLPLVPVNLALLGAGSGRRSRRAGFALGCAFGLGIALSYGALGLFSAATGRAFGFLHGHLLFHVAFAVVFCLLALAMLDAIRIDFSALRNLLPRRRRRAAPPPAAGGGPLAAALARAFAAGIGSALLAGACVAPALVGALLVSAEMLRTGDPFGAAVPFALGLGMALPWPALGAGLAVLPRPGAWMRRVKQLFAILFLAAAVHFLLQAFRLALPAEPPEGDWIASPAAAAVAADATRAPVVLALTADWCAACREMERGVLEDPAVRGELAGTIRLRIDCTDIDTPRVRSTLRAVGARGLPFYAILETAR